MNSSILRLEFWRSGRSLPILRQTEAAECGLACLGMIAGYWGQSTDLIALRRRFEISIKGATLKSIISIAEALAFKARPIKVDLQNLRLLPTPAILHWTMNHFVVLKKVDSNFLLLHDPAVGPRRISLEEASKLFTGVAVELTPRSDFVKRSSQTEVTLKTLIGSIVGLKRGLVEIFLLGVMIQICALMAPFYVQWVVDEALLSGDTDLLTTLGIGFILLVILQAAVSAARSWVTTALATNFNFQWFGNAFSHLLRLPTSYFEKRHLGDIVSRFNAIQVIQKSITTQFVEALIDGVLVITTLAVMLLYSVVMSAVTLAVVGLYTICKIFLFARTREATAEQIVHAAKQQTFFLESARGHQTIRLFGNEQDRQIRWTNMLAEQFNAELKIGRLNITGQTLSLLFFNLQRVIVIWIAAFLVLETHFSIGMLIAYLAYQDQFTSRASALVDKVLEFRLLRVYADRIADMLLTPAEVEGSALETESRRPPVIALKDVSFRYADGEAEIVKNVNLVIPSGQSVAITGPSGCGKTTLVKIILGLLQPTTGSLIVDGRPLLPPELPSYRKLIGSIMQDDRLFSGSIAENITFFDPSMDRERIVECATLANIHEDIVAMPMGYNTLIGDLGVGLSGGQTQRILLARAVYKRPQILVLDEATSHLDISGERTVNEAIEHLSLTRIIVAHRSDTIASAQRKVVMQRGVIVEDTQEQ